MIPSATTLLAQLQQHRQADEDRRLNERAPWRWGK